MRYESWDVLLFPENSKIPIQEFKTQCFVTPDRDSPCLHNPGIIGPAAYHIPQGNLGQIPVLTTFVPSLPHNAAFRVSIHNWEKPQPSRLMDNLLQPEDQLSFEARVFVDGVCVSGTAFRDRTNWPHIIGLSSQVDKSGNPDHLRFPPFHQEILEQRHWDAGDFYGRIRVVISEGFHRPSRTLPFERVKDIVAFSFQHAPLQVLEYSNIAWPNSGMWSQGPRLFKYQSGSAFSEPKEPDEAHAHSPTKHESRHMPTGGSQVSNSTLYNAWAYRNYQPAMMWQNTPRESKWSTQEPPVPDNFIDPYMLDPAMRHRGARSSLEDIPMPDYLSSSTSSRAFSSMTGISYQHSKQPSLVGPLADEQYSQFLEALSPPKMLPIGTHAPTNTPSATLPMGRKLSAAAEARSASYSKSGSRSVLKEISQPGTREVSGSSARSNIPPDPVVETASVSKLHSSPSGPIRGRKEAMSDNKENEGTIETPRKESDNKVNNTPTRTARRTSESVEVSSESKRNRSTGSAGGEIAHVSKEGFVAISPTHAETDDHIHQAGFDEYLNSNLHVSGAPIEIVDIE